MRTMVRLLSLFVVIALSAGIAFAGCGHKETVEGKLQSVAEDGKTVVVVGEDGTEVKLTLTAETQVTDAEGKEADVSALVGTKVKVVSEHAKVDSIAQMA